MTQEQDQLKRLSAILRDVLGDRVVGVYLFGSAVHGGLKPRSDLDIMVVTSTPTSTIQKERLVSELLRISSDPRHLEVTVVVETDIRPWRHPPRMDFQYGDWWREEFQSGNLRPWKEINPDLASLISMVLASSTTLQGPPPNRVFEPVPRSDYIAAVTSGIDGLMQDLESDTRNVVLTLARIWNSVASGESLSKDAAADWVIPRLSEELQPVLAQARSIYLGELDQEPEDFVLRARAYADHVVEEIRAATHRERF